MQEYVWQMCLKFSLYSLTIATVCIFGEIVISVSLEDYIVQ